MKKVYLAGFDVFAPDAKQRGVKMKMLCAGRGLIGLYPLDNEAGMEIRGVSPPKSLQVLVSWEQELLFKVMEACMDSLRRLVFG